MTEKRMGLSSVTLIVLGNDLDPSEVTRALGVFPDQAWSKGERPKMRTPDGRWIENPVRAEWGGWKKFMPQALDDRKLEIQLEHWARELESRTQSIRVLRDHEWLLTLDCFLASSDAEVVELKAELLAKVAAIGVNVDIHFYPDFSGSLTEDRL